MFLAKINEINWYIHNIIFYILFASLCANLVAKFMSKHSFYDHLKDQFLKEIQEEEIEAKGVVAV